MVIVSYNKVFWNDSFCFQCFSSKEAVLKSEDSSTSVNKSSKLWSCVMANSKPSTWQHENLEGVIKYGTTIRRQPTKTEFKRIKKLLFTSRKLMSFCRRMHDHVFILKKDVVQRLGRFHVGAMVPNCIRLCFTQSKCNS